VHNEEQNVPVFLERLRAVLDALPGLGGWEIVFVNNGSDDLTLARLHAAHTADPRVRVVSLARDFGYQAAVTAGLTHGDGDLYAVIDVDGEDPPEVLPRFLDAITDGAHIAYGIRSQRPEPTAIILFRRLFYYLNRFVADAEIVVWMAEFSMLRRVVRDAILVPRTTYPFLRAEIGFVGFTRVGVPYVRQPRMFGKSHYNLWRMTTFAVAGILSSSTFPLRLVLYLAAALAFAFPLAVLVLRLGLARAANLAVIALFYFLLMAVPTLSLYLARTYKNGVARPVFIVDPGNSRL
jgi:dolichol-phosphate mannosyltransferase